MPVKTHKSSKGSDIWGEVRLSRIPEDEVGTCTCEMIPVAAESGNVAAERGQLLGSSKNSQVFWQPCGAGVAERETGRTSAQSQSPCMTFTAF